MKTKLILLLFILSLLLFTSCDNTLLNIKSDNSTIEPQLMQDAAKTQRGYEENVLVNITHTTIN